MGSHGGAAVTSAAYGDPLREIVAATRERLSAAACSLAVLDGSELEFRAAGRRLGMSRSTVTPKIESGEIMASMVGTHHRIPLREFEAFRDRLVGSMVVATSDDIEADLCAE